MGIKKKSKEMGHESTSKDLLEFERKPNFMSSSLDTRAKSNDEEQGKLLNGVTIAHGGVLPNIHSVILPKKSEMVGSDEAKSTSRATKLPKIHFPSLTFCFDCASALFYSNMIGDFESCIPVLFDPFTAYYQYPWHLSEDHEWYSVFIDKEDVNVREMKVDVVERLMKVSMKERDDMRRYIAYELLLGVRVSIRLCPRNTDDLQFDADFADSVELQPELKRRVHDGVAKPVVEGVLNEYNGTVMAYGQTGIGKTYTVGQLGKDDISQRGMIVRAMEDILKNTSSTFDIVEFSYLQLYLEHIHDLLVPKNNNIPIVEDSKMGEVFLPGAEVVKVRDLDHFLQLLQIGEANRHAANTKMNTESSRSHAILMINVRKLTYGKAGNEVSTIESDTKNDLQVVVVVPTLRKSKLLIMDLAGSERIDKSGNEDHMLEEAKFINLSLTSLVKCINALAENSPHIPTRDSKLTRLLRDSFRGTARTSLIVTIGPSARYHSETTSTIMFGQRAMKIVNMLKLKEEFDYESLCRKLENRVDFLTAKKKKKITITGVGLW
ncbi:hypothetical protein GIB67_009118 [Kingdonia uniflora]|uniref:Kinesin motor domain-containing protein n=1 Tax=Kingdonia uniflora TaxID=39325 RepID=A0A7J7N208_9MAGN|nr:hypothetical protein GIB67_009118 [Kingdonia uniflora]